MNNTGKGTGLSARVLGLVVLAAVLAAVAAHAAQMLLIGEASTAVTGGVASSIAVIVILGLRRRG